MVYLPNVRTPTSRGNLQATLSQLQQEREKKKKKTVKVRTLRTPLIWLLKSHPCSLLIGNLSELPFPRDSPIELLEDGMK